MNLNDLLAAGCVLNAGYLDHYDAVAHKHTRVAQLTVGGDVIPTIQGEVFMANARKAAPPGEPEAEVVEPKPKKPKKGPAAAVLEDDLDALDAVLEGR